MIKESDYRSEGTDIARQIVDLLQNAEGDYAGLEEILKSPEFGPLVAKLSDSGVIERELERFVRPEAHSEAMRFRRQVARRRRLRRITILSAAAVVAMAITIPFLRHTEELPREGFITRVTENVTLVLPDGSEVVLDSSNDNSRIADLGGVAIVRENGQLVHQKNETAEGAAGEVSWGSIVVPRGTQTNLLLEDGTRVWLNANSRLRFPVNFSMEERRVFLEGEAYFEVAPDAAKPFYVVTHQQMLRVIGTEFNVYAYPEEPSELTTLLSGSIALALKGGGQEITLQPGEQGRLSSDGGYDVIGVDAGEVSAWRMGMFIFNDTTLEMVFRKLSRWYDFEYQFEDPSLGSIVMMGNIPVDFEFDEVVNLINDSKVANVEMEGNRVIIRERR